MAAPQVGAKGDSRTGRGDVLADKGHSTWTRKAKQVQWLLGQPTVQWLPDKLAVMKVVSGQSREPGSKSARCIARLGHSCRIAQARAKGGGWSWNRACRQEQGSPQDFSQLLFFFLHIMQPGIMLLWSNCTVSELGFSIGSQTLWRWEWKSLCGLML